MSNYRSYANFIPARWITTVLILAGVSTILCAPSLAQRRGGWDPEAYVKGLDVNGNGKLETSEVSGRTEGYLKNLGFKTGETIRLDRVLDKVREDRGGDRRNRENNDDNKKQAVSKVPTLGAIHDPVPSFGASAEEGLDTVFTDDVIRQVNETIERYDRNGDKMLDRQEIERARWGKPAPEESDTNGDGKLSRIELSNRYRAREQFENGNESNNDRGQNDEDEDRNDRGRTPNNQSNRDRGQFGSQSSNARSSSARTSSRSGYKISTEDKSARFASYADSLIKQYDTDKDGNLNEAEIGQMKRPPRNADADKDGTITKDELISSLSGGSEDSTEKDAKPATGRANDGDRSSRAGASRSRSSGSLGGLDKNENNQVEMHEFSDDWDEKKLAEFYEKDKNGDGVITLKEWSEK